MKKRWIAWLTVLAAIFLCVCSLTACGGTSVVSSGPYKIIYSDEDGKYEMEVFRGVEYEIQHIPEKYGYDFIGLFDSETDGLQYVGSDGKSIEPFWGKNDLTLYPRFALKKYSVYFDGDGGTVDGLDQGVFVFNEQISYVPTNAFKEGKHFTGWYTQPEGRGTKVANATGILPEYSVMNEAWAQFIQDDGTLHLYAGYEWNKYTVTAYYSNGDVVRQSVQHGANVANVSEFNQPHGGLFVTKWKIGNVSNAPFDGVVIGEIELYPYETKLAVTITFNGNGGSTPSSIVVCEGSTVTLPTSTRSDHRFNGWSIDGIGTVKSLTIGSSNITATASWTRTLGTYSNYNDITIKDVHTNSNPYDGISLSSIFGKSISALRQEGFTTLSVSFTIRIVEKNDGYQEVYFGTHTTVDTENYAGYGRIWYHASLDTAGNKTSSGTHSFSFSTSLSNVADTMYFSYSANGILEDTWTRDYIEVTFRIS